MQLTRKLIFVAAMAVSVVSVSAVVSGCGDDDVEINLQPLPDALAPPDRPDASQDAATDAALGDASPADASPDTSADSSVDASVDATTDA